MINPVVNEISFAFNLSYSGCTICGLPLYAATLPCIVNKSPTLRD